MVSLNNNKKLNLDYEKKILNLLGYKLGKPSAPEGSQNIEIWSKEGYPLDVLDGVVHVHQLHDGSYMNQICISKYGSNVYCCDWRFSTEQAFPFSIGNYKCSYNPFKKPSSACPFVERFKIKNKEGDYLSLGFFDYTLNASKKSDESPLLQKTATRGFYMFCRIDNRMEKLILSNMSHKPNHRSSYIHLVNGRGINITCYTSNDDIETIAKNDVKGIEFFNKMREKLNEILPYDGDALSFMISNEEIKKYGLSIYIEPKKEKGKNTGRLKEKQQQN